MAGRRYPLSSPRKRTLRYVLISAFLFGVFWWFRTSQSEKNKFQDLISGAIPQASQAADVLGTVSGPQAPGELRSSSTSVGTKHEKGRKSHIVDLRRKIPWTTYEGGE